MPELPDVELYRRRFLEAGKGRRIGKASVRDERLLKGIGAASLTQALEGRRILGARRHGKHLLAELEGDGWLVLHFGMTGDLLPFGKGEEEPRYTRLRLDLSDGGALALADRRRLGSAALTDSPEDYAAAEDLGPDALDDLREPEFRRLVAESRATVKGLLMDQSKLAGVGNIYADEILFQSRLDPERPANGLSSEESKRLFKALREVLETAIDRGAGAEQFLDRLPEGYLLPHRKEGAPCPRCSGKVARRKVAGRSSYLCPSCQK